MEDILLSNRKIIKRLLASEASKFCFYRVHEEKGTSKYENSVKYAEEHQHLFSNDFGDVYYDILEITIHQSESIEFKLSLSEINVTSKSFVFKDHQIDDQLYKQISESVRKKYSITVYPHNAIWKAYHEAKADVFVGREVAGELDEHEIANFINLSTFDLKNFYKFYTKEDFVTNNFRTELELQQEIFEFREAWKIVYKYGLIFREKFYHNKSSDFGYDNYLTSVISNPAYFKDNKPKIFLNKITPREAYPISNRFWEEIYDYFFDEKSFILVNYDEMPLNNRVKLFRVPQYMSEKCFIVTFELNREMFDQCSTD